MVRNLGPSKNLIAQCINLSRQRLAIVGMYDYNMILCKLLDPFVSPGETLVKGEFDRLPVKSSKPESRTSKEANYTREFHQG